ncbi:MAG: ABC transporter permease [Chloroflexi bacterium]|nr:ABC transporter permease [Chloroflexota bacterium]
MAVFAGVFPLIAEGISESRIFVLIVLIAVWAFWVWRNPRGGTPLIVPLLAILTAFVTGAIVIMLAAEGSLMERVVTGYQGYAALVDGAFLRTRGFTNTLVASTPLILTGLAVALAFRAGLFNIGAEGQYLMGATFGVVMGYAVSLPPVLHTIAVLIAGAIGGGIWGAIPGFLKARLGAHEVINTIMMNFIAIFLVDWLINNPLRDEGATSTIRTPFIEPSAQLPQFSEIGFLAPYFATNDRLHLGFIIAILAAVAVWYLLWKTTVGFELRTTGANPDAARYAGIKVERSTILAMTLSGALAGLAGAIEVQGVIRYLPAFFEAGYGFDAIAVALLAQNNPFGVIPASILFGALSVGADILQIRTGVSQHIISIIQALILLFVAAPALIRYLYRLRNLEETDIEQVPLTRGWGS